MYKLHFELLEAFVLNKNLQYQISHTSVQWEPR